MDVKKFGFIILILGVIILLYGAIVFGTNQPKKFDRSESQIGVFGGRDDFSNWLDTKEINAEREQKRKQSTNIMLIGGIVVIIGGGLSFSSSSTSVTSQENTIFCTNCGKKYSSTSVAQYCEECGKKL